MTRCAYCGESVEPSTDYCPNCGGNLRTYVTPLRRNLLMIAFVIVGTAFAATGTCTVTVLVSFLRDYRRSASSAGMEGEGWTILGLCMVIGIGVSSGLLSLLLIILRLRRKGVTSGGD